MKNNLSNKTILITGAAGGIGEALCTSFAEANGTIILHYNLNRDKAESLLQKLPGMHHRAIQCDLSNADQVNTMFSAIDHVDIVINNAAVVENHEIDSLSYQDWQDIWERTIGANLIGPANIMYLASKFMIKNGGGKFINISSRGAFRGEPSAPAYGASKAGLNSLGQSLAKALAKDRVFVYTIAPGFVDTERVKNLIDDEVRAQSPLNRVAKPQEIADTALWLATGDNEFLTGCIIDVNGASYLRS
jgi:3-oxoacyl-[acyl-carrier protein] reductase